jgi:NAD(P)-dependent dehydrogenase (short-subunit alcohol dehydrogenase family)|tara:strand:- start:4593 stop:5288 length:696 start_codon:yes stop_codon:yes gene_type:complete
VTELFSVKDKIIIVTGSNGGIGSAIAAALSSSGAIVIRVDLPRYDITNTEHLDSIVADALSHNGEIHGLVNCAGVTCGNHVFDYSDDDWEKTYKVNLKAPYQLSRLVAQKMQNTGGSIVNITSINAELAFPDNPAYVASKGGLKQLTKSLALDLGKYNIRVNNVGPGYIRTNMTKKGWSKNRKKIEEKTILGRWGTPEDLVGTVIFLLSSAAAYITGQDIYVDGGWLAKGL